MKRKSKKTYLIILIAAFAIIACYVFYRVKKQAFLRHQLTEIVKDKTNRLYNLSYDSIYVNEATGNLFIKNLSVKGDTALQLQMIKNGDSNAAKVVLDIYVPLLKVIGFKTARALLSKQLVCNSVVLLNPRVNAYVFPGLAPPQNEKKQQEELYKQILGKMKLIRADSISVLNSQVTVSDFYTKEVKFSTVNTSIHLSDVAIDSTFNQDTSRTLFCKKIAVTTEKVMLGASENSAKIWSATFDTQSKIVALAKFEYDAFKNKGSFKTSVEGISFQGIEWKGPVENSELIVDKATFEKGDVESVFLAGGQKQNEKKESKILTGWIKSFSLNALQIKEASYTSRAEDLKKKCFILKNNSFNIQNLKINRNSEFNGSLVNDAKEIELKNDEISLKSGDNLYAYKVSGITLNTRLKKLLIKSVKVTPLLSESAFAKKVGYQKDRFDVSISNIICTNVNVAKLIKGEVNIDNITTETGFIKDYLDLSYPLDTISTQGQQESYPQQIIHMLGFPLHVRKFTANNLNVEYKEKNAKSHASGKVRFLNSNLSIYNISNYKAEQGEKTTAIFTTNFLEKIPISGRFTFSSTQWQKGVFTAEANVSKSIDATILNQLTEPMSLIKIEKGVIDEVHFKMTADTNTSNSTLILPYHDLKISLLKKNGSDYNKKGISSLFANIIVRNNNEQGKNLRRGDIVLTRNKYRSFFNFIWTSIFKGIKETCMLKL